MAILKRPITEAPHTVIRDHAGPVRHTMPVYHTAPKRTNNSGYLVIGAIVLASFILFKEKK